MKITTTYSPGDKVYVYTKNGLELKPIVKVIHSATKEEKHTTYCFSEWGDGYTEDQIIDNYKKAVTRL